MMADVIFDSSQLLSSLLTHHQRQLLELIFFDNAAHRDKYLCVFAEGISPDLPVLEDYLDSGDLENEVKQILEYVNFVEKLPDGGKLFVGTHGLVLVSPHFREYELIFSHYLFLKSIEIFLSNYFSRIWSASDNLKVVKRVITEDIHKDPRASAQVQTDISLASTQCVLLEETLQYLEESLTQSRVEWLILAEQFNANQRRVVEKLAINSYLISSLNRVRDTRKIIRGLMNEIQGLRDQVNVINEKRLQSIFTQLKAGTAIQHKTQIAAERQESGTKILEIILSGSLAFDIVAVLIGEYTFVNSGTPFISSAPLWLLFNIFVWFGFSVAIFLVMRAVARRAERMMLVKVNFETPITLPALDAYLDHQALITRCSGP